VELYHDHFQNYKRYNIPKAQLIIADIPYNIGVNAYASSPQWYKAVGNSIAIPPLDFIFGRIKAVLQGGSA